MKPALRVAVLMGGPSAEHDISLKSGQGVREALAARGHDAQPVVVPNTMTFAQAAAWARGALERLTPEVVFIAMHGPFGEDGTIQQVCEDLHLAYVGSDPAASGLGMDKVASRQRFVSAGLAVPRWQVVTRETPAARVPLDGWRFPLMVKPAGLGSSIGVHCVHEPAGLAAALLDAGRHDDTLLVEEFIQGRELTVGMLGDQVLPVVEIIPKQEFFDVTAKYTPWMTTYEAPARLPPPLAARVQNVGRRAHAALGCRHLSRTDLILNTQDTPVVLEINTIPGFTPTSLLPKAAACLGMSYGDVCEQLVRMALHDVPAAAAPSIPGAGS